MARVARIVIPGALHHVTQRGNNRQDVFFVDGDRRVYLKFLREQGLRHEFQLVGYCLMTNHVHLIGVPAREDSLAKAVGRCHFLYTQYVNRLHGRSGHLWQNRFYSCAMDDAHATTAMAYVEANPVRARMARRAWEYTWSSAAAHCGAGDPAPGLDLAAWRPQWSPGEWRSQLEALAADEGIVKTLRSHTHTGRPLGSDSFLSKIEHRLGHRVRPLAVGRPKGWRKGGSENNG